jgi:hypothetical protein
MWIWEDGISLDQSNYKNWKEGEPNTVAGNENVAELIAHEEGGKWNDIPNYVIRLAVCEVGCPPLVVEEAYQTEEKSSETLTKEDDQIAVLNNIAKNYTSFKYLFIQGVSKKKTVLFKNTVVQNFFASNDIRTRNLCD